MPVSAITLQAYHALADRLAARRAAAGRPLIVGLCGAQGSGKSTGAAVVAERLGSGHGLRSVVVALDDFYLTKADRLRLAADRHPLYATRGVPGTHEVAAGIAVIDALRAGRTTRWPRFDKARDDRAPPSDDHRAEAPADLVLFEGWCVGLPAEHDAALDEPVNALERDEDRDGCWRRTVNARLAGDYADWFARLDVRVFLAVPDFAAVLRWRGEQEADTARAAGAAATAIQTPAELGRFIQHYERLTRHALRVMPDTADAVIALDRTHAVRSLRWR